MAKIGLRALVPCEEEPAMPGLDLNRSFLPLSIAVLTVSDTRSLTDDRSGDVLVERLNKAGHRLAGRAVVTDDIAAIQAKVRGWIADPEVDVVITTGGTGFTGRDVTPEAIEPLLDKRMDGFSAVFHRISFDKIGTSTIQSRATTGPATSSRSCRGSAKAADDGASGLLRRRPDLRPRARRRRRPWARPYRRARSFRRARGEAVAHRRHLDRHGRRRGLRRRHERAGNPRACDGDAARPVRRHGGADRVAGRAPRRHRLRVQQPVP